MTWGETATNPPKFNGHLDKKVAVSPSRPLNCYAVVDSLSTLYLFQLTVKLRRVFERCPLFGIVTVNY